MEEKGGSQGVETIRVRILPDGRLTRRDAALYLGVRPKTLAMWALQGKGPPVIHIGRRAYYALDDLNQFIAAGRAQVGGLKRSGS